MNKRPASEVKLPRSTRGRRPHFFADPAIDQMMTFILELATEVAVLRERQDTMERLLERDGQVTRASIEAYEPSPEAEAERVAWRDAYLQRVLRLHNQGDNGEQ